ncbi:DUF6160 family protein [Marinobacter fonticola]|uniref:DUF6160 family protein n=1 Tax=Marinobacter fonticola TaxID=2603215 RepID=UPI0011E78473|nr:DUF6160 family protein [Marinobacter fonticola]
MGDQKLMDQGMHRHRAIRRGSLPALCASLTLAFSTSVFAELRPIAESELAKVSGQSGISIEIPHLRVNAHGPDSVDDPDTAADESDGRRTQGFKLAYVTREHGGGGEAHYFANEVSLAMDVTGAMTVDIEKDGAMVVGLPERINFVGDGLSFKDIYLNGSGVPETGTKLLNEINVQGNFNTAGTIRMWGD